MRDKGHPLGKRRVSAHVIAVLRSDHDVLDWLRGDRRNIRDQTTNVVDGALPFSHQHTARSDNDEVVGGETAFGWIELLVAVDVLSKSGDARKVCGLQTSDRNIAGAYEGLRDWSRDIQQKQ